MTRNMGKKCARHTSMLRSAFLGTTSIYALLLTAPAAAQDASNNCTLPDISNVAAGSVAVPPTTTQIYQDDINPTGPNSYFVNCSSLSSIGYVFDGSGNIVIVNVEGQSVDTSTIDGGSYASPNVPTFAAFTTGGGSVAAVNFGNVYSTGIALSGGTITGDLVGYNSGTLDTAYIVTSPFLNFTADAPLAPGMVFVSGSANNNGISSTSTDQTAGVYSVGGNGGNGLKAGNISVVNTGSISTGGISSAGIMAIAAGGNGGVGAAANADNQYVSVAVGGNGGSGGDGGAITIENSGSISTLGLNSMGIKALSVGGGGGSGGTATAQSTGNDFISASFAMSIGGSGGVGGNGEAVTVDLKSGSSVTTGTSTPGLLYADLATNTFGAYVAGDHSPGVLAQSIGGGGGSGGHAVSLAQGGGIVSVAVAVSKGGTGGAGGDGEAVTVNTAANTSIVTGGRMAGGIVAQSIGGGGGSGGTVNSQSNSTGVVSANVSVAMGAAGGAGGSSGAVEVNHNGGSVTTYGAHSTGITAQSISGGGGNGGNVVDGAGANAPLTVSAHVNMGGDAGNGGTNGSAVANISSGASVTTYGDHAGGMLVQSIGGGGGAGGSIHSFSSTTGGGSVSDKALGMHADSLTFNANVNLGGTGGAGAHSGGVSSGIVGTVETHGVSSNGVMVQSIGGGGGAGGHIHAVSTSVTADTAPLSPTRINNSAFTATVDLGGSGSSGGDGNSALVALWGGSVTTNQIKSSGIVVQSIGGGGGAGGYTSSLDVTTSIPSDPADFATRYASFVPGSGAEVRGNLDVSLNLGGSGGSGGNGSTAQVVLDGGSVTTQERQSHGVVVQSIGGGGGIGGHADSNGFAGVGTYNLSAAVGGRGGGGGGGGAVQVSRDQANAALSTITTHGDQSYGIFAHSVGGGGGMAGAAHLDLEKAPAELSNFSLGFTLGGSGGNGGSGGTVNVSDAVVSTDGVISHGVVAQSVGGGGGDASLSDASGTISLDLGGKGGTGGTGGIVTVQNIHATTGGDLAVGLIAQSVGGGGGLAGVASVGGLLNEAAQSTVSHVFNLNTHGTNGYANDIFAGCKSGRSDADCDIDITTSGVAAAGMLLQSIGGGGSATFLNSTDKAKTTIAFNSSGAATSGLVSMDNSAGGSFHITTNKDGAVGVVAQSIADVGGALFTTSKLEDITVTTGNAMGGAKAGGLDFSLHGSSITTNGHYAPGLYLQSGNAIYTVFAADGQQTHRQVLSGGSYSQGNLQVKNHFYLSGDSSVTTVGTQSHGIVMNTYSYFGSTNAPTADGNDRSLNMWIDGNIHVSGADSWGVMAGNTWDISPGALPIPLPNNVTTAFTLGDNAKITADSGTAGGVKLWDSGNLLANINGIIDAGTGTAIDITAANTFLTVGNPNEDVEDGFFQKYYGDILVTGNANGGTNTITLNPGAILYGSVTSDTSIGAKSVINVYGTIQNAGSDAIVLGDLGGNATVSIENVYGNVSANFNNAGYTVALTNRNIFQGSIFGPIDYHMAANASHGLYLDPANNTYDSIVVNTFSRDQGASVSLELKSLPSQETIDPMQIFAVTDGASLSLDDFNIDNDNNVITYTYATALSGTDFTVNITDIQINLVQSALTGEVAKIAPLAQAHVNAVREGYIASDPTDTIQHILLLAANAAEGTDGKYANLEAELSYLIGSSLDPDAQSTTNSQRNATDSMHSCGGSQGAAMNPTEQGECVWSSVTRTNMTLGNAGHDESATNLAAGWQKKLGEKSFLGFAFAYDIAEFDRTSSTSDADRLHAGAIYKYVDGNLFASSSLLATYARIDAERTYFAGSDATTASLATSTRESLALASRLRAGYRLNQGAFDFTPMVDLDLFLNRQFQYQEEGAGGLEAHVSASTNFLADLHPRAQVGTHFDVGSATVRLYGEIGQRFALNDPSVNYGLADGLAGDGTVKVKQEREGSQTSWGLGMIADLGERFEMRLTYDKTDGSLEKNERFGFKLAYKF